MAKCVCPPGQEPAKGSSPKKAKVSKAGGISKKGTGSKGGGASKSGGAPKGGGASKSGGAPKGGEASKSGGAPKSGGPSKSSGTSKGGGGSAKPVGVATRKRKDPNRKKRIPNMFILYYLDMYRLHGGNMYCIARECGRRWHLMEQSEKDKYKRLYCNLCKECESCNQKKPPV